jgi:hypothetical protein
MANEGKILLGLGLAAAFVIVATRPAKAQPVMGEALGTVTDISGTPVSDAAIKLNGYSGSSGNDGKYDIANVTPGTYTMTVSKQGYQTVTL